MVIDLNYWTKVFKRILFIVISVLLLILFFKVAVFYMPFLIAFIISIIIEPLIRKLMKTLKFSRKVSSIIVFITSLIIIFVLSFWGITTLLNEASNLLHNFNEYFDKGYNLTQNILNSIDYEKIHISKDILENIELTILDFFNKISEILKSGITKLLNIITSIPAIAIYTFVTILSLYFICTDKIYIIDQIEHHLPKTWTRKIWFHYKEIVKALGGYLKAQAILIIISFFICLIGLVIFKIIGFNIHFPLIVALGIGFVDALPLLGSGTIMVPWGIISALNGDIKLGIGLIILWLIITIIRQLIEPKIVSGKIGIHPIFTLIAMYTGFKIIGVLGMFLGPIILIIVKNLYSNIIENGIIKTILDKD